MAGSEMSFTDEQLGIMQEVNKLYNSKPCILIEAGSGVGKTTTCIGMLKTYYGTSDYGLRNFYVDENDNIDFSYGLSQRKNALYLVFNRAMADYFKSIIKHIDIPISLAQEINLGEIVDAMTYHSFLKSNDNMLIALKDRIGIQSLDEVTINYAKGSLNKKDIFQISRILTNNLYKHGLIKFDENKEATIKAMQAYSSAIFNDVELFLGSYLKSGHTICDLDKAAAAFQASGIDLEQSPLVPYRNFKRLLAFSDYKKISPEAFFAIEINKALDEGIRDKKVEISHSYYYKRIYEFGMKSDDFLKKIFAKYDLIAIDEAQDADEMIFNLVYKYMNMAKQDEMLKNKYFVATGDPKQSIYEFNGSYNIFEWADQNRAENPDSPFFKDFTLTKSFRYGANIAAFGELISKSYRPKDRLVGNPNINDEIQPEALDDTALARFLIENFDKQADTKAKNKKNTAIIFRTNSGCIDLLDRIRSKVTELIEKDYPKSKFTPKDIVLDPEIKKGMKDIYKKNIFTVIENETIKHKIKCEAQRQNSDFDWEFLSIGDAIKNEKIVEILKSSPDCSYLADYNEAFLAKYLHSRAKNSASVIITNVHQSKGKEYATVILGDDYLIKNKNPSISKAEVYTLHTAATRAKYKLAFYESSGGKNMARYFYINNTSPSEDIFVNQDFWKDKPAIARKESVQMKQNLAINFENEDDRPLPKPPSIDLSKFKF